MRVVTVPYAAQNGAVRCIIHHRLLDWTLLYPVMLRRRQRVTSNASLLLSFLLAAASLLSFRLGMQVESTEPSASRQLASWSMSNATTWQAEHNVVHVVQTRFMQHQPTLLHLAEARLQLLKAFTLPSLQGQTNQDFLWIIRIDPDLDQEIRRELVSLLEPLQNVVVLASNENPEGFRGVEEYHDLHLYVAGNWPLLQAYQKAAESHTALETRLDADDAMELELIDRLQKSSKNMSSSFRVFCVDAHVEWQHYNPWEHSSADGALLPLRSEVCVTPGLTAVYPPAMLRSDISHSLRHHHLHQELPRCRAQTSQPCLQRVKAPDNLPLALRARTITSAGMGQMWLDGASSTADKNFDEKLQHSSLSRMQREMWEWIPRVFGTNLDHIRQMRAKIEDDRALIALDALKGQCTVGHSCKKRSKEALQSLIEAK